MPNHRRPAERRFIPAAELDALFAADRPGPDPDLWKRDMDAFDELVIDDLPTDPWERGGSA